jgi:aryl-alcohol dehydrogenase-like predicted oxidoreductase
MRYVEFGQTDLEVSAICFGTWQAGGDWGTDYIDLYQVHWPDPKVPFAEGDWRAKSGLFQGENFRRDLEKVEELGRFAADRGHTVAQLAVAWTLSNPAVDVAIVGARRPSHIEGTAPAAEFDLSEEDVREIDNIMQGAVPVRGPSPEGM